MKIPLIKPFINQDIKNRVNAVLDSGYLTEGPVTKEFEETFRQYIGCKHAIAVTSATTGLEVALRALNIGPGDEVIVPDYTYPATASVVAIVGATAVLVDVCRETMLIDYKALEEAITPRTKAIIPVSGFGNPLDYSTLNKIKEKHNLYIIEDAACAIGAEYKGIKVGNFADISVFSLHPRKFITTGEGGMITTENDEWAAWIDSYKHFGMDMKNTHREGIQFNIIGTNYKLSNILAAVGLGQMKIIDELLLKRRELAKNYIQLLSSYTNIGIPKVTEGGLHSYQTFCVFLENRNNIMKNMREKGIEVQIGTYALHKHKAFRNNNRIRIPNSLSNSCWVFNHTMALPLYNDLTFDMQKNIINSLLESI